MNKGSGTRSLWAVVVVLLLIALGFLSLKLPPGNWANLVLVTPKALASVGFNINNIEEFCEDQFLVTYEITGSGRLNNGQTAYSTTLVGTNSCYPFVLNYPVLAGGFWSQSAWKGKERQLVLNEKAAFHILGGNDIIGLTLQLDGEIWLVSGVIRDDYEDEVRAYLPSSQSGGSPKSLLALSKSTLAYAASALKDLGVQESAYDIVSLEAAAHQYRQWWLVALFLFHCLIFSLLIRWGIVWLKVQLGFAREQLRHLYPKEFLRSNRKLALKSAACLLLSLVGVVVILILLIRTMAMVLSWQDLPPLAGILTEGAWLNKIAPLVDYRLLGLGLFWGFMAALLVYAIVSWRRKKAIRNS